MNKKVKIGILKIAVAILLILGIRNVYHFAILNRVVHAITQFRNEENRAYLVEVKLDEDIVLQEETFLKHQVIKYVNKRNGLDLNYKWKNLENDENYFVNVNSKEVYKDDVVMENKNVLRNLPNLIEYSFGKGELGLSEISAIHYIIPTKYNHKSCYKIDTKNEVILIDKETYLPVSSFLKLIDYNGESENIIEKKYEFKVGEVTDEDVALPNLSEYTIVKENE